MNCVDCKNYCGFLKTDIDYIKCNYWQEIEFRAAIGTKAIVCPRKFNEETDGIIRKAIDFVFSVQIKKLN